MPVTNKWLKQKIYMHQKLQDDFDADGSMDQFRFNSYHIIGLLLSNAIQP